MNRRSNTRDYAKMSDPEHNPQFRRRWNHPQRRTDEPPARIRRQPEILSWRADDVGPKR